jgi:ABC-type polysaccharide/polyol phosphate transport system ATPase subunit
MAFIKLDQVDIEFPLLQASQRSFKRLLTSPIRSGRIVSTGNNRAVLHGLRGITLDIKDGDRYGVIGANGAGKSTLLRVLAGIYPPVRGTVEINGKIGALLTAGLGVRDDVSGYQNIEFCLLLQGADPREIPERVEEIAEFTGLGEYLDLHVGAYSSGMRVKLAFAISTALDPEILVIDEIFGAGDAAFIKKAEKRMTDLIHRSNIFVFASHAPGLIEKFCDKAIWLDNGRIREIGSVAHVNEAYADSII